MEGSESEGNRNGAPAVYCVTGATGYIGSWLVKTLLERGHTVHATVRDPAKCLHLLPLWAGSDRLRLLRADLEEEGSFDEAVKGCDGVFHVAASMQFSVPAAENSEGYVQLNIIDPAIKGTLDLLKSCLKSGTVNRVVLTSSISTMTAKDSSGNPISVVDESCKTPVDRVSDAKASGWVYALSKILTEEAAFRFASENGINLVAVITSTVGGPFLTSNVPLSIRVLLSPLTGDSELYGILSAVNARMGSIALVHIEDICDAHIFLMEHDEAEGRYICAAQSCPMSKLVLYLAQAFPSSDSKSIVVEEEQNNPVPSELSSKKLGDLGFNYKHGIEDIINQSVSSCLGFGLLPRTAK
ncbi:PREDICTED: dihydroflavonol-4-reductase [Fragaria vesca subsp. vesca]|uniref:DFR/ANS n=1 Tax=Fragaria ananassa TaxID=3747 RepID=A0A2S1FWJ2_FRAAN|nr:PREDICTED: dihydroflavonol-4-reductase [Fragaria vesca subsp. vesca]AWD77145.1 dihydroflavonol-4-reductase [Fragaria x ananassa]QSL97725.1 DFR/ANS [Fragaria x ananassa]